MLSADRTSEQDVDQNPEDGKVHPDVQNGCTTGVCEILTELWPIAQLSHWRDIASNRRVRELCVIE
jgi:hypothetical protein